jgi:parallel beta-helix repeat protein
LIHGLSNNTHVINNSVSGNFLDGIVVHDSHGVTLDSNIIQGNRNGVRLFAGSVRTSIIRNSFHAQQRATVWVLNGSLDQAEDLRDYSSGPRWNSQNISRHNDGRVWSTLVAENHFFGGAEIIVDEARYFISSHNRYFGNVLFDVNNSNDVSLDGCDAEGSIQYRMRRDDPAPITYSIDPSEGAILSVVAGDRIELHGDGAYFPADNQNFTLELAFGERPVIAAAGRVGSLDVQTGQLIDVPISVASGSFTLSSYLEGPNLGDPIRFELTSADWLSASIMFRDQDCALFE